jgi:hypothetical protein
MMDLKKILAVGIILLFIGVSIAPNINFNVVKASNDNDLVEITTQACGIKGFGNTTVKLTREQYQDLEQYLVEFRARLNQTTTREEAVPIFKEAVVELNKYELLPKGMSIKTAQQLVTGRRHLKGFEHLIKRPFLRSQFNLSDNENLLCLVYGFAPGSGFNGWRSFGPIFRLTGSITNIKPINILHTITLGQYQAPDWDPGIGWVDTFGLNGKRIFHDQWLYGALPVNPLVISYPWGNNYYYPGIMFFTGLHITSLNNGSSYYLGSALWVKIGSEPPE